MAYWTSVQTKPHARLDVQFGCPSPLLSSSLQSSVDRLLAQPTAAELYFLRHVRALELPYVLYAQYVIAPYIVDFCCPTQKLVIELDGFVHDDPVKRAADYQRTAYLHRMGYRVVRFRNEHVFHRTRRVLSRVKQLLRYPGMQP